MKFQTRPVQINAYKVGTLEGRIALQQHQNAFESKNLWDCWEIRTPEDNIELVTKEDWVVVDNQGRLYPIALTDLLDNHIPLEPITHCFKCGNPTGYKGIDSIPMTKGQQNGLCLNCAG